MLFGSAYCRHALRSSLWLITSLVATTNAFATEQSSSNAKTSPLNNDVSGLKLVVGFDRTERLRTELTSANGTDVNLSQKAVLSVPESLLLNRDKSTVQIFSIDEHHRALVVTFPTEFKAKQWQALVVLKPDKSEPVVLYQGFTGYVEGEEGLRRGPVLEISEPIDNANTRRIVLGERREELTLCGRPATLSPKMLSPKELAFKPAKLQRLTAEERERAPKLVAEPHAAPSSSLVTKTAATDSAAPDTTTNDKAAVQTPATDSGPSKSVSLLRAVGASSAIGWPVSLTDGDPETTWAENRGGAGRGEFVTFRAPSDVPLQGFDFVIKPGKREIPKGAGPDSLWLVTSSQVFSVSFPSDPWKAPLVSWHVTLPTPAQTDCVAVVTESAYAEKPDSEVTFAEISAQSEFATADIDQLVGALAGGGPRAESASTILSAMGTDAYRAVAKAFLSLDEDGKRVALDVLDHAPCSESNAVYIQALLGKVEAHRLHAVDRLRRCGTEATTFIEQALGQTLKLDQRNVLELFAEIAPDRAITFLAPRLSGNTKTRRMLREVVAEAARSPRADSSLREQLSRSDLPKPALIELLRAVGTKLTNYGDNVSSRIEQLLATESDWKTRYLLVAPAHLLAKTRPTLAQRLSALIRQDQSPYVRLEAVRSVEEFERFAPDLFAATNDPEMRVRQAATQALSNYRHPSAQTAIRNRLNDDRWPEVRAEAATALAAQPPSKDTDKALIDALDDDAWLVRVAVADALGTRQSLASGEALLERLEDSDERFEVRVAAANSLGQLCYEPAIDTLTKQAKKLDSAGMDLRVRAVAASALNALGQIHPPDLTQRLNPLLSNKNVPKEVRQAAEAALNVTSHCRKSNPVVTAKTQTQ